MKKRRFFYHYYRAYKCLSLHWKGACHRVQDVEVHVPTESKWRKGQPQLVIQGWAEDVEFVDGKAIIR